MSRPLRAAIAVGVVIVLAALPLYLESFWLQTALFAMGAIVAAIGLTLLVGIAGQLSLAHAFFVAIGAYGYAFLAGQEAAGEDGPAGLGPAAAARADRRRRARGARGRAVQPDLGPGARHLPRARVARPRVPRPARAPERHRDHRRLRGRRRRAVQPARLQLLGLRPRADDLRRVLRAARAPLVPRHRPRRARDLVRPQPRPQPPGPRARQRPRRGDRRGRARDRRRPLQGRRLHRLVDVRGAGRRADRARVRPHRARSRSASCCRSTSS